MSNQKPIVFVTIEGGVAEIHVEGDVIVRLRDYDCEGEAPERLVRDADGTECYESFFGANPVGVECGTPADKAGA